MPKVDEIIKIIQDSLSELQLLDKLKEKIPYLQKALASYEADIQKAQDTGHEYYLNLIGDLPAVKDDINLIKIAKSKINEFE